MNKTSRFKLPKAVRILLIAAAAAGVLCVCLIAPGAAKSWLQKTRSREDICAYWGRNLTDPVYRTIAITELTEEYDLLIYSVAEHGETDSIEAAILIKDAKGRYQDISPFGRRKLSETNQVEACADRQSFPGHTIYWGIAESSDWVIDYEGAHQITVDGLTIGYYFHDKPLEEALKLEFVKKAPSQ